MTLAPAVPAAAACARDRACARSAPRHRRDVFEDGVAAQLATDFGLNDERVGLAFAHAEFGDVVLDVVLVVIGVIGIVELTAARRFQVVDPGQLVLGR